MDFAFLSFSSSQKDFVYCVPAQTIAHTARSAPREIAFVAIFSIRLRTDALPSEVFQGCMEVVPPPLFAEAAQSWRNLLAVEDSKSHRAKLSSKERKKGITKMKSESILIKKY